MRLSFICESVGDVRVVHYGSIDDEDVYGGLVYKTCSDFTSDEIYVSRDSDLLFVAFYGAKPVGCVWGKVSGSDDESYNNVFSVDVVVAPRYRSLLIGPKLIRAAIDEYYSLKSDFDGDLFMGCEVVNHKLAEFLQRRYNFQHVDRAGNWGVGEWSVSSPFLVYDGSPVSSRG